MTRRAVALALLVVGAGLAGVVPASAFAEATDPREPTVESHEVADRTPPKLPEQWQRTYGGSGDDIFADLVRTDDGGYLLVGWNGDGTDSDGWILKVDSDGREVWTETIGGPGIDRLRGVVPTENGYLLAGRADVNGTPNGWLVELGPEGEVRSNRTVGAGAFYAVARESGRSGESSAGYLLAGWTYGDGTDGWLLGLDADRAESWRRTVSTPEGYRDGFLRDVVPTESGYYLAGKATGDSDDGWALKLGPDGATEWQTTVGGASRDDVWAAAPASAGGSDGTDGADGGFVIAGETESDSDGPRDGWLVKFGPDGSVDWERSPGGEGTQWLDSAMRTEEGYLFTGSSDDGPNGSADGYVLATDESGEPRWRTYYGTGSWDKPWPAIRAHDAGYLLAGQTGDGGAGLNGWLVRIGTETTESGTDDGTSTETATPVTADATTATEGRATDADDGTTESPVSTTDAGDEALRAETDASTGSPPSVPGFGVGAALLALAAFLLAVRR